MEDEKLFPERERGTLREREECMLWDRVKERESKQTSGQSIFLQSLGHVSLLSLSPIDDIICYTKA